MVMLMATVLPEMQRFSGSGCDDLEADASASADCNDAANAVYQGLQRSLIMGLMKTVTV